MPYIGTQPLTGQFKKLDAISVVNGQAAYTLNYNSAAYKPATANALLVSVNGVIQAAGDAYTINGSTITFTENLVTGDVIDFIIALGDTGSAVTPVDGSVTTAKLGDGSVTNAKIDTVAASKITGLSNAKEQLAMICDGQNYTVSSGTYTPTNVTAKQELTTSYATITGSELSYTPPSGTTCVIYDFTLHFTFSDAQGIGHFKFFIDSDEVTNQRLNLSGQYSELVTTLRYVIPIGGSASTTTGRQATWTSAKTLKIQATENSSSNQAFLHSTTYWDGGSATDQFHQPKLVITALG